MSSSTSNSALKDFVQQQKSKSSSLLIGLSNGFQEKLNGGPKSFFPLLIKSPSSSSADQLKSDSLSNGGGKDDWLPSSFKEDKSFLSLTRTQRIIGFVFCLIAGTLCFGLASMYIPVLVFKARKFGALYSLGSCFILASFALLRGPTDYARHSFGQARLPMTLSYLVSLTATLYCSLWIRSTVLTIVCVSVQVVTLLWFLMSYVPGGETGLKFISSIFTRFVRRKAASTLPV